MEQDILRRVMSKNLPNYTILFKRIKTPFLLNSIGSQTGILSFSSLLFSMTQSIYPFIASLILKKKIIFNNNSIDILIHYLYCRDNPYTHEVAGDLLPVGEEEHYLLAKRLRERFGSIFQRPYTPKAFEMHTTEIPRYS